MKEILKKMLATVCLLESSRLVKARAHSLIEWATFSLQGGYDPKWYWEERGKNFREEEIQNKLYPAHQFLLEQINAIQPQSILEVGCGFGRNIKFLLDNLKTPPQEFVGVDISKSMLQNARDYLGESYEAELKWMDSRCMEFPDNAFDLVFTYGTLMHIRQEDIDRMMDELKRVARHCLISIEEAYADRAPDADGNLRINRYTVSRNYVQLFKKHGFEVSPYTPILDGIQATRAGLFGIVGIKK